MNEPGRAPAGPARPITAETIASDLEQLGLHAGDTILLRGAPREVGVQASGRSSADVLLDGALCALGPEGTVSTLTFTRAHPLLARSRKTPFERSTPPNTGGLAAALLQRPDVVRSRHPTNSWAALGPQSHALLAEHDQTRACFYPIGRLLDLDGKMIIVGSTKSGPGFSTVHYAQEQLGLTSKTLLRGLYGTYYRTDSGDIHWYSRREVPGCSQGFWKFYGAYVREGVLRTGTVGKAHTLLINARDAYEVDRGTLERDPRFGLCDNPACGRCALRTDNLGALPRFLASRMTRRIRAARRS